MSAEVASNLISAVGFPIACVIGLAFFVFKIWNTTMADCRERENKYNEQINKFASVLEQNNDALNRLESTLALISERLDDVEKEVKEGNKKRSAK